MPRLSAKIRLQLGERRNVREMPSMQEAVSIAGPASRSRSIRLGRALMSARVICPHCDASFRLPRQKIGKKLRCNVCQEAFTADEQECRGKQGRSSGKSFLRLLTPGNAIAACAAIGALVLFAMRDRLFPHAQPTHLPPIAVSLQKKPEPPATPPPPKATPPSGWTAAGLKLSPKAIQERTYDLKLIAQPKNASPDQLSAAFLEMPFVSAPGNIRLLLGSASHQQVRFNGTTATSTSNDPTLRLLATNYRCDGVGNLKDRRESAFPQNMRNESKSAANLAAGAYEISKITLPDRLVDQGETWKAQSATRGDVPQFGDSLDADWTCTLLGIREASNGTEALVKLDATLRRSGGRVAGSAKGEGTFHTALGGFSQMNLVLGILDQESGAERKWELTVESTLGNPRKIGLEASPTTTIVRGNIIFTVKGVISPLDPQLVERRDLRHKSFPVKMSPNFTYELYVENVATPATTTLFPVISVLDPTGRILRSSDVSNGTEKNTKARLQFQPPAAGIFGVSIGSRQNAPGAFVVYIGEFDPAKTGD
jgi:hypothetical protein